MAGIVLTEKFKSINRKLELAANTMVKKILVLKYPWRLKTILLGTKFSILERPMVSLQAFVSTCRFSK